MTTLRLKLFVGILNVIGAICARGADLAEEFRCPPDSARPGIRPGSVLRVAHGIHRLAQFGEGGQGGDQPVDRIGGRDGSHVRHQAFHRVLAKGPARLGDEHAFRAAG